MIFANDCVMLTVSDKTTNDDRYERSGKICGQIQVKTESDCGDSEPQVNAEGVLEIKPRTNDNMNYLEDKTLANGILKLGIKIKTEPGIECQGDQPDNFNQCPLHGESGTEHVVEQTADCSTDSQFQPIIIAPQPKSSEISTVRELPESNIPVASCQTILYDSVLGATTVNVDILSNDTRVPQQQPEQKSPNEQKQVWPKYMPRRNMDSSRRHHNQKRKSNEAGLLTYYGHNIKPCSVKLKRLKLTLEVVRQLYSMHQKAKQNKYYKLKMQRSKRRLAYECSSSEEDDCGNSPNSGISTEIKESGKIVPDKCSRTVKELSDMGSDATTVPAIEGKQSNATTVPVIEGKQSTESDSSCEDIMKSETDHDGDCESDDPNFLPEEISGEDTEEAYSSNCSESDLEDVAGDLGLI